MSANTTPYQQVLQPRETDFTEWSTGRLQQHLGGLMLAASTANVRKHVELKHEINVADFELRCRRADFERFQERMAAAAGQTAVVGAAGC